MARRLIVLVIAGLVLCTCSVGALHAGRAGDASWQCKPHTSQGTVIGNLKQIVQHPVYLGNKRLINPGAPLRTNSTLCTSEDGIVEFTVTRGKKTWCEMYEGSRVRLYPPMLNPHYGQVIVRFEEGETYCATDDKPKDALYDANGGKTSLLTKDPLFAVHVGAETLDVKVKGGYIEVSKKAGVVVGPMQQVTVVDGGLPGPVEPFVPTPEENKRFGALSPVPSPDFTPPDPAGSPALTRILARGILVVAIDEKSIGNADAVAFVKSFFGFLATSWKVKPAFKTLSSSSMSKSLRAKTIDIGVTPATTPSTLDTFPLVAYPKTELASVVIAKDKTFEAALTAFLRGTVNDNHYGTFYRATLKSEPPYGPLTPVLLG